MAKPKNPKVIAYRRENGRVGIRNHVVILPLDDLSNSACEKVAHNVKGTKAIPHAYGRLQFGKDLELFFRTMIGTGANPNVAAVVVIGIEPEWTNLIVKGIAKTGKPVSGFSIERFGEFKTVEMACWKAKEYVQWASELHREECNLKDVWVSVKCGESDTTSGLASNPTVGNAIEKLVAMGATSFGETGVWGRAGGAAGYPNRRAVHAPSRSQKMIDDNKTAMMARSRQGNIPAD
jgi:(2R)-sulfolactate sulfo-lyase subunit beta